MNGNGALLTLVEREISPGVKMTRVYINPQVLACLLAMVQGRSVAEQELGRSILESHLTVAEHEMVTPPTGLEIG